MTPEQLLDEFKKIISQFDDTIFDVPSLADYLHTSASWVYTHSYLFPHFKLEGHLRFRKKDIDSVINQKVLDNRP